MTIRKFSKLFYATVLIACMTAGTGCESGSSIDAPLAPRVSLETTEGKIVLELFEDDAPNTVANFITLIEKGSYDNTEFHRVISGFMAQGGRIQGGPGYCISTEISKRKHVRGVISMANRGRDTENSQFFITTGASHHLDGMHSVFGKVIEGQMVVDLLMKGSVLKKAKVLRKRNHKYSVKKIAER